MGFNSAFKGLIRSLLSHALKFQLNLLAWMRNSAEPLIQTARISERKRKKNLLKETLTKK